MVRVNAPSDGCRRLRAILEAYRHRARGRLIEQAGRVTDCGRDATTGLSDDARSAPGKIIGLKVSRGRGRDRRSGGSRIWRRGSIGLQLSDSAEVREELPLIVATEQDSARFDRGWLLASSVRRARGTQTGDG